MLKFLLPSVLALILFVGVPRAAFAHASPMLYEPAASAVLQRAPARVRIQFTERIEPKASSISVFAPDGSRVEANDGAPDAADARVFSVGMRDAGPGTYTVSWQVVSEDDGHFTKGGFSFGIGTAANAGSPGGTPVEVIQSSTASQAAAIGVELLGQAVFIGILAAIALLWRPLSRRRISDLQQAAFERACSRMVLAGALLTAAGVIGFVMLKTVDLQLSRSAGFVETLGTFVATVDGRFALYRAFLGIAFAGIFFINGKTIFRSERVSKSEILLFASLVLMLLARARVSHAAASHLLPNFSIFVNAVHLLSKEFWIGLLIAVTFVLMPVLIRFGRTPVVADTLTLSSKYISIALGATGVTGAYIVWLHLKSPSYVFTTEWGTRFVVLAAFGGALAAFRLYNQIVVEKVLIADCTTPQTGVRRDAASSWRYSIPMEMCVGIALLFVTSQLIITTPPYPAEKFTMDKRAASQGATIGLSVDPIDSKQFLVTITDDKTGAAASVSEIVVTLQNSEKNIGPLVADTEQHFAGGFVFPRGSFSIPGDWDIEITARRPDSYDAVGRFRLDYPKEVDASRVSGDQRHWGGFEMAVVATALASLLVAWALYRFSARLHFRISASESRRGLSRSDYSLTKSLAAGLAAAGLVSLVVWASSDSLVRTDFQRLCEANGGTWAQSPPMRAGIGLSSNPMIGCTVGPGDYHFVDVREYTYFVGQPNAAEHHHH